MHPTTSWTKIDITHSTPRLPNSMRLNMTLRWLQTPPQRPGWILASLPNATSLLLSLGVDSFALLWRAAIEDVGVGGFRLSG